jgi:hypothetical protein
MQATLVWREGWRQTANRTSLLWLLQNQPKRWNNWIQRLKHNDYISGLDGEKRVKEFNVVPVVLNVVFTADCLPIRFCDDARRDKRDRNSNLAEMIFSIASWAAKWPTERTMVSIMLQRCGDISRPDFARINRPNNTEHIMDEFFHRFKILGIGQHCYRDTSYKDDHRENGKK